MGYQSGIGMVPFERFWFHKADDAVKLGPLYICTKMHE